MYKLFRHSGITKIQTVPPFGPTSIFWNLKTTITEQIYRIFQDNLSVLKIVHQWWMNKQGVQKNNERPQKLSGEPSYDQ